MPFGKSIIHKLREYTALLIVETQFGEISSYIPTNVISPIRRSLLPLCRSEPLNTRNCPPALIKPMCFHQVEFTDSQVAQVCVLPLTYSYSLWRDTVQYRSKFSLCRPMSVMFSFLINIRSFANMRYMICYCSPWNRSPCILDEWDRKGN